MGVSSPTAIVAEQVDRTLGLYDVPWPLDGPARELQIEFRMQEGRAGRRSEPASGRYLTCVALLVDPAPGGLYASTPSGTVARARFSPDGEAWQVTLKVEEEQELLAQVDDALTLAVTTAWRRAGWVPLHAAGLVGPGGRGIVACATGGGGKTTFVMGMLRRGWRLLGDDKLLLRKHGQGTLVVALQHSLNVGPRSHAWFPDLEITPDPRPQLIPMLKQRMFASAGSPDWRSDCVEPTDVLLLTRADHGRRVGIAPLSAGETLAALLRQIVVPGDRELAAESIGTLARLAASCRGWVVTVGENAYALPTALDEVEAALR